MNLRSGHPFWLVRNGLLHTFAPLTKNERCDVVVVGAGITGALVAWHLAKAGFDTVVLDKRDVAWGSTAASTALLQYELDTPLTRLTKLRGQDEAVLAYQACRSSIEKLRLLTRELQNPCDFALRSSIQVAPGRRAAQALREEYEARRQHGFDVAWLTAKDLRRQFGFSKPGAIHSKEAGQVDPYQLAYQLLTEGQGNRLRVYDRTAVVDHELRPRSVSLRTDRGTMVRARHVVFATGYEVVELLERKIVNLRSTFALVSEPLPEPVWHEECLFWERADPYLYFRTTADHRVMIGGEDEPFVDADKRDALLPAKTKKLLKKFASYFPHLPCEVAFAWAGTFGETKDGLPYIGQVDRLPGAFFTLGFGGNGIIYSILAAELIRDRLLQTPNPYDGLFQFDR